MSHDETRNKILNTLYQKYYGEPLGRLLSTVEIIKEAFPDTELTKITPEIDYLEDRGYLKGEHTSGVPYPRWIRIEEYGIDRVEENNPDLTKAHYKIRLKILSWLYQKYFDEGSHLTFEVDKIVNETEIGDPDSSEIIQEFNYLQRKGLIDASRYMGRKPIMHTKISAYGIDEIETIVETGLEEASTATFDESTNASILEIKNESDPPTRTTKALQLLDKAQPWADIITRIAQFFIGA